MPLLLPGGLNAFNKAASSLVKKHKFNLLCLYILSLAKKYPTAVKMLRASLSELPAKFTLKDLHRVFGEISEIMVHHQRH